jgi:hypothetical protein
VHVDRLLQRDLSTKLKAATDSATPSPTSTRTGAGGGGGGSLDSKHGRPPKARVGAAPTVMAAAEVGGGDGGSATGKRGPAVERLRERPQSLHMLPVPSPMLLPASSEPPNAERLPKHSHVACGSGADGSEERGPSLIDVYRSIASHDFHAMTAVIALKHLLRCERLRMPLHSLMSITMCNAMPVLLCRREMSLCREKFETLLRGFDLTAVAPDRTARAAATHRLEGC